MKNIILEKTNSQKLKYVTVLNVICSFAVVLLHANGIFWSFSYENYWISANVIESLFYFAVPIFFMISGCNLMDYRERYSTPQFILKRVKRVLIPFLFWSIVGFVYQYLMGRVDKNISVINAIVGTFNTQFISVYWFFIPLFTAYLCIPVLSLIPKIYRQKAFGYIIVATMIFSQLLPLIFSLCNLQYNFGLKFPLATEYVFFLLCGYYLNNYAIDKKFTVGIFVVGAIGLLTHLLGTHLLSYQASSVVQTFKGYLNVPCVSYSLALFLLFKKLDNTAFIDRLYRWCRNLTKYTFGVYLIHWYLLDLTLFLTQMDNKSLLYRLGIGTLTFVVALVITKLISLIPLLKRTV